MMDRRSKIAVWMFFAIALINPRDFPFDNVPLVYPAFALFWMSFGTSAMFRAAARVRYLLFLLVGYQSYFTVLRILQGHSFTQLDVAYLVEPPMVLIAASAATLRQGGSKVATWAFVTVVAISAAWGVGIYTVGEPFTTVRSTIQQSIGGTVATGSTLRNQDLDVQEDLTATLSLNAGLSSDVVSFGYQLSAAILVVMAAMLAKNPSSGVSYPTLSILLAVLMAGAITNTERATVASVAVGLAVFLSTGIRRNFLTTRSIALIIVGAGTVYGLAAASEAWDYRESLVKRISAEETSSEKMATRLYMSVPAAMTIFYQPFGAGDISEHYSDVAFQEGWLRTKEGVIEAHSPHNHFAGVIMFCGIVGLVCTILLFRGLWKKWATVRFRASSVYARLMIGACAASVFHSLLHNAGFFGLVPSTLIVFGILWSDTAEISVRSAPRKLRVVSTER